MSALFEIKFEIDLAPLVNIGQLLSPEREGQLVQAIQGAVRDTGDALVGNWTREAMNALKTYGGYTQAITEGTEYPFEDDPLHFVVTNRHKAVRFLEDGIQAFDMKKMLQTSAKVKTSKDGKRYMSIPFEHSRESLIKAGIDPEEFGNLAGSERTARLNVSEPNAYRWGERLQDMGNLGKRRKYFIANPSLRALAAGRKWGSRGLVSYEWKSSPFENVYRFKDTQGKTSGYVSFRTISENSDENAWIHPGIRAMHIAEKAVADVKPMFQSRCSEAVKSAIREALG